MEPFIAPKAIINVTIDKTTTEVSQVQHILGMQSTKNKQQWSLCRSKRPSAI